MEQENIWAIVSSGVNKLIGVVHGHKYGKMNDMSQAEIENSLNTNVIRMSPVYELHINYIPMQDRKTGGIMLSQQVQILPYALTTDSKTPVYVMADSIQFLADMSDEDSKRYREIIDKAEEMSLKAGAQASGIHLASPQDMPKS